MNIWSGPLSSNLFDSIRIKPRQRAEEKPKGPVCEWEGCEKPAEHRAPKGRGKDGEFFHFCKTHVREYNKSFNYFAEMDDDAVSEVMRQHTQTGGRPTWQQSTNGAAKKGPNAPRPRNYADTRFKDPLNLFARAARTRGRKPMTERELRLVEIDKRAFETLGFEARASSDEIKKAYKDLVKKHHPDANGGDRASEDRFRNIVTAYKHLKDKGFVT